MLVDRRSGGDPGKAGSAYAVNVLGCILGPLLAGFVLLPYLSERWSLIVLSLPWLVFGLRALRPNSGLTRLEQATAYALVPLAGLLIFSSKGYDEIYPRRQVLRDSTATVIATGNGMHKKLLVNGYGMTMLTPITKMMAHLPLAFLDRPPQNALDICFGMGTTFRSLLSWNLHATAVELVPSVPPMIGYFHKDGPEVLQSPLAHVVIDDGRRYLERTTQQYDLITIDPPPPVEAAGSSMLYSEEFYAAARSRLRPGGILAQWLPTGDAEDFAAVAGALRNSFPYVRVFLSVEGQGMHFLASEHPLPHRTAEDLQRKLPAAATADFTEWDPPPGGAPAVLSALDILLKNEVPIETLIAASPATPALRDDRPINEYCALRRLLRYWHEVRQRVSYSACCVGRPVPTRQVQNDVQNEVTTCRTCRSQLLDGPGDLFVGDDGGRRKEQVVAGDAVDAALHGIDEEAALEGRGGDASGEVLGRAGTGACWLCRLRILRPRAGQCRGRPLQFLPSRRVSRACLNWAAGCAGAAGVGGFD